MVLLTYFTFGNPAGYISLLTAHLWLFQQLSTANPTITNPNLGELGLDQLALANPNQYPFKHKSRGVRVS